METAERCELCEDMACEETCEGDEVFGLPMSTAGSRARARVVRTIGEHVLKVVDASETLSLESLLSSLRRELEGTSGPDEARFRAEAAVKRLLRRTGEREGGAA